jgi:uncharacterized protein YndB with AHSA1/START domain
MESGSVTHDTFVIERTYPVSADRVFAAFSDEAKKRRWYAESNSHDVEEFSQDFRIGGAERLHYRFKEGTPFKGVVVLNEGVFQNIVPNQCIVTSSNMSLGGKYISASLVTIEFLTVKDGTDLVVTHQGAFFEGADGPEMRQAGWRVLLERLANRDWDD